MSASQADYMGKNGNSVKKPFLKKAGIFLIILSFVFYGGVLIVPFTTFTIGIKTAITSALVISGEISFWVGGIILGKEIIMRYKKYLNPMSWFKKEKN